jgi:hypothetical protein
MNKTAPLPGPEWAIDFCRDYTLFLFGAGKWTLIAGILLGVALAVTTIVLLLMPKKEGAPGARTAVAAPAVLDAIKGFLQALSSAPTWLALFGGGVLLLWMAGNAIPERCVCQAGQPGCAQQAGRPDPAGSRTPGGAGETANRSGNANTQ